MCDATGGSSTNDCRLFALITAPCRGVPRDMSGRDAQALAELADRLASASQRSRRTNPRSRIGSVDESGLLHQRRIISHISKDGHFIHLGSAHMPSSAACETGRLQSPEDPNSSWVAGHGGTTSRQRVRPATRRELPVHRGPYCGPTALGRAPGLPSQPGRQRIRDPRAPRHG